MTSLPSGCACDWSHVRWKERNRSLCDELSTLAQQMLTMIDRKILVLESKCASSSNCRPKSLMSSDCNPEPPGPLSSAGARIGLTFIAQSACISFIAVVSLLAYVSLLAFRNRHVTGWSLITSHLDFYLLGLLFSDLIQSIGGIMDIKWIAKAGVFEGSFCTAQGIIKQFGDVGVALCSLAIAVHTFAEVCLRWKEPSSFIIPIVVLALYAIFLTLIIGVGYAVHRHDDYYGDTIYWCWITSSYLVEGITLEYLWLWVSALANLILYIPIFLALKGIIVVEPSNAWARFRVRRTTPDERAFSQEVTDVINPRRMLFYPAVYIVTVLPQAVSRITALSHPDKEVPFPATVFSGILFSASGIFNVIVYTSTRPTLLRPSPVMTDSLVETKHHAKAPKIFWSDADQKNADARSVSESGPARETGPAFEIGAPIGHAESGQGL